MAAYVLELQKQVEDLEHEVDKLKNKLLLEEGLSAFYRMQVASLEGQLEALKGELK
jgi:hypothetical protein